MTKDDYLDMLAEVQRSVSDTKTQVAFLESMVKFLPIGQQRGVRAYFADVHSHLRHALHGLQEQEEWLDTYCPPQMHENERSSFERSSEWVQPQAEANATVVSSEARIRSTRSVELECEIPTFQTMPTTEGE